MGNGYGGKWDSKKVTLAEYLGIESKCLCCDGVVCKAPDIWAGVKREHLDPIPNKK